MRWCKIAVVDWCVSEGRLIIQAVFKFDGIKLYVKSGGVARECDAMDLLKEE